MSTIVDLLSLGHVPRWVIVRHHRSQSVAEHSFNVACIAHELYVRHESSFSNADVRIANILLRALYHDLEECITGDMPTPAKKLFTRDHTVPPVADITSVTMVELQVVKLADLIDAYTWIEVHGLGSHAQSVTNWLERKLYDYRNSLDWADEKVTNKLVDEIQTETGRLRT